MGPGPLVVSISEGEGEAGKAGAGLGLDSREPGPRLLLLGLDTGVTQLGPRCAGRRYGADLGQRLERGDDGAVLLPV